MAFMGAMMLIVLPLFLVVSARMTAASDFGKTIGGKFIELVFYSFAALCLFGLGLLIYEIVT